MIRCYIVKILKLRKYIKISIVHDTYGISGRYYNKSYINLTLFDKLMSSINKLYSVVCALAQGSSGKMNEFGLDRVTFLVVFRGFPRLIVLCQY